MSTIAVLVLGIGWWVWPRVDQRFVGEWEKWSPERHQGYLTLDANGVGLLQTRTRSIALTMVWWTDGEDVVVNHVERGRGELPEFLNTPADQVQRLFDRRAGKGDRWKIVVLDDGRLELHSRQEPGHVLRNLKPISP